MGLITTSLTPFVSDCGFAVRDFRLLGARRGDWRAVSSRPIRVQLRGQRSDHRWPKGPTGIEKRRRRDRLLPYLGLGRFPAHGQVQVRRRQRIHRRSRPGAGQRRHRHRRRANRRKGRRRDQAGGRPSCRPRRPVRRASPVRRLAGALLLRFVRLPVQLPAVLVRLPTVPVWRCILAVLVQSVRLQRPIRLTDRPQVKRVTDTRVHKTPDARPVECHSSDISPATTSRT